MAPPPRSAAPRTRLDRDARRAQLVELGVEMLSTRRLEQVAIDEIAAQAGISRGLLFHYFPTKHDFHVAVVSAATNDLLERTEPDRTLPLDEQLRSGVAAFIDAVAENREAYTSLVRGAGGGDPELLAIFESIRAAFADRVLDRLGPAGDAPEALVLAVRGWVALSEEVTIVWLAGDGRATSRDEVIDLIHDALWALVETAAPGMVPPDLTRRPRR